MAARAYTWGKSLGATVAYGVVMDGTPRAPSTYTGRFGIPAFGVHGHVCVLRLPVPSAPLPEDPACETDFAAVSSRFPLLSPPRFAPLDGIPTERSLQPPVSLVLPDGCACGLLEDTRRAKRLLLDDGTEMQSAHLSRFAYADPIAGATLLRQALARCARHLAPPALFVSVPAVDTAAFLRLLGDIPNVVQAPATIYASSLPNSDAPWNLSTAEI